MAHDPKYDYPEFPAPIHYEPTDPPEPAPLPVSPTEFYDISGTLGASRVEADATHKYVTYNGVFYATALAGAS